MKKNSLSTREAVFFEILSRIINLTYLPGASISETELAKQLGVSRTPVREALVLLNKDGLVEVFPKRGTFVTKIDLRIVREVQFVREAIELSSLNSLQENNADLDIEIIKRIEENLQHQEIAAKNNDVPKFFTLDEAFHESLLALARHERAWKIIQNAKPHLDRARILGFKQASPPLEYFHQHKEIFENLAANNFPQAYRLLRAHLRTVFSDSAIAQSILPEFFTATDPDISPQINNARQIPPAATNSQLLQALAEIRISTQ